MYPDTVLDKCTAAWKLVSSLRDIIAGGRTDRTYPRWSDHFLCFCERTADTTLDYLKKQLTSDGDEIVGTDELLWRLSAIIQGWELLHTFIKPVLDADNLKVPYPLVHFLTEHVGQLQAVNKAKLVIEISPELNYFQHQHSDLRRAIIFLQAAIGAQPTDETLGFLALPCSQSKGLFMNCLLYHEVGHFMAEETGLLSPAERASLRNELENAFRQHLSTESDRPFQQYLDWAVSTTEKWIEELFADLVAVNLLGLAYTLSYMELLRLVTELSEGEMIRFSIDHPADALRFREQLKVLVKDNWREHVMDLPHWGQLVEITATSDDKYSVPSEYEDDPDMSEVWLMLIQNLCKPERIAGIHRKVDDLLADRQKPSELYSKYAKGIKECLAHAIVPSNEQSGSTPHPISIINGGTLFLLCEMAELYRTVPSRLTERLGDRAFLESRIELWCLKAIDDWLITTSSQKKRT